MYGHEMENLMMHCSGPVVNVHDPDNVGPMLRSIKHDCRPGCVCGRNGYVGFSDDDVLELNAAGPLIPVANVANYQTPGYVDDSGDMLPLPTMNFSLAEQFGDRSDAFAEGSNASASGTGSRQAGRGVIRPAPRNIDRGVNFTSTAPGESPLFEEETEYWRPTNETASITSKLDEMSSDELVELYTCLRERLSGQTAQDYQADEIESYPGPNDRLVSRSQESRTATLRRQSGPARGRPQARFAEDFDARTAARTGFHDSAGRWEK
jgi:hypothetical protein